MKFIKRAFGDVKKTAVIQNFTVLLLLIKVHVYSIKVYVYTIKVDVYTFLEDLIRAVISYEIYETLRRLVS